MAKIRYVQSSDSNFWFGLDKHLPKSEFKNKVRDKQGYLILEKDNPCGLLRYNLFWDGIPFCTMLFVNSDSQGKGYGKKLLAHWENDMKNQGHKMVLTSTRSDENAQNFYRKSGYKDCGGLVINIPDYEQPLELFLIKLL